MKTLKKVILGGAAITAVVASLVYNHSSKQPVNAQTIVNRLMQSSIPRENYFGVGFDENGRQMLVPSYYWKINGMDVVYTDGPDNQGYYDNLIFGNSADENDKLEGCLDSRLNGLQSTPDSLDEWVQLDGKIQNNQRLYSLTPDEFKHVQQIYEKGLKEIDEYLNER